MVAPSSYLGSIQLLHQGCIHGARAAYASRPKVPVIPADDSMSPSLCTTNQLDGVTIGWCAYYCMKHRGIAGAYEARLGWFPLVLVQL